MLKVLTTINHICQGLTIVHAHVVIFIKALELGARYAVCNCFVPNINRVV